MQGLAPSEIFLFEDFRLDRHGGGLFCCNGAGTFEPVAIGSRALDILGVLIERAGDGRLKGRDHLRRVAWNRGRRQQPDGTDLGAATGARSRASE